MSGRPSRAAAQAASGRLSALLDSEDEAAPVLAASRPPPKRSRSGKRRPESRRQSRVRAGSSQLSPGQKMQRMRLWFEQNDGIPPRGDKSAGFDMGAFWSDCCTRDRGAPLRSPVKLEG